MTEPIKDSPHPAFATAERLAPTPYDRADATHEAWLRHYLARALAAHTAFRDALGPIGATPPPGLGYLMAIATAATAAAVALVTPTDQVALTLWSLTPEAGALNGQYIDWLAHNLDALGINPADIEPAFHGPDFNSPCQAVAAAGEPDR